MRRQSAVWIACAAFAAGLCVWTLWPTPGLTPAPRSGSSPALLENLGDDGFSGAPCPARSEYERAERRKHGPKPPSLLALRLREKYPLGSSADVVAQAVKDQGFILFSPCPNDENVEGGKYLSPDWGHPDAFVYWRRDARDRLIFLDGHTARPTR